MTKTRTVTRIIIAKPTMEGAGVKLNRVFGNSETALTDPFLLLDDFSSANPADFIAGFPWHPHRGIETITYVLSGEVRHEDSLGNKSSIGAGDVQWMTAGSGIIHQEMPVDTGGPMLGFQLWANLPASYKMMKPRYQEIKADRIPVVKTSEGYEIRIICGAVEGVRGPVEDIIAAPEYLDVTMPASAAFIHGIASGNTAFAYVISGSARFDSSARKSIGMQRLALFDDDGFVRVQTDGGPARFLLICGKPIREPIAWYGPIVMNTEEELRTAFREYEEGSFIK